MQFVDPYIPLNCFAITGTFKFAERIVKKRMVFHILMCTNENALKKSLLINLLRLLKGREKQHRANNH